MTSIIIELATKRSVGAKIDTKAKTDTEMTAMTKLGVGLKKKITYIMRMICLTQKLKDCEKFYKQKERKRKAIGFKLAFSENPAKILDSIHSLADVDHLIVERNEYGKSQKGENLTKEPHDNINNTSGYRFDTRLSRY